MTGTKAFDSETYLIYLKNGFIELFLMYRYF